jgi:hypothetical protein
LATATTLTETGTLPSGVKFLVGSNGTATFSGTPAAGAGGNYSLTITASNAVAKTTQPFTLNVDQAPAFTSAATATFVVGQSSTSFKVTTRRSPDVSLQVFGVISLAERQSHSRGSRMIQSGVTRRRTVLLSTAVKVFYLGMSFLWFTNRSNWMSR